MADGGEALWGRNPYPVIQLLDQRAAAIPTHPDSAQKSRNKSMAAAKKMKPKETKAPRTMDFGALEANNIDCFGSLNWWLWPV